MKTNALKVETDELTNELCEEITTAWRKIGFTLDEREHIIDELTALRFTVVAGEYLSTLREFLPPAYTVDDRHLEAWLQLNRNELIEALQYEVNQ